jgi:hypothetical protein
MSDKPSDRHNRRPLSFRRGRLVGLHFERVQNAAVVEARARPGLVGENGAQVRVLVAAPDPEIAQCKVLEIAFGLSTIKIRQDSTRSVSPSAANSSSPQYGRAVTNEMLAKEHATSFALGRELRKSAKPTFRRPLTKESLAWQTI